MKRETTHNVVLERKIAGEWAPIKASDGSLQCVIKRVTREQMAWMNQACKADWCWIEVVDKASDLTIAEARLLIKRELKRQSHKVSYIPASEITLKARQLIDTGLSKDELAKRFK